MARCPGGFTDYYGNCTQKVEAVPSCPPGWSGGMSFGQMKCYPPQKPPGGVVMPDYGIGGIKPICPAGQTQVQAQAGGQCPPGSTKSGVYGPTGAGGVCCSKAGAGGGGGGGGGGVGGGPFQFPGMPGGMPSFPGMPGG